MINSKKKLKVAYFSPLPPSRTGISDYSVMLLPYLCKYYEVEVVVDVAVTDSWVNKHLAVRDVPWFIANAKEYDRVIYHIGNSSFHYYMFDLIERFPGVIVLHDFFLGHAVSGIDEMDLRPGYWSQSLYISHGQHALNEWFKELELERLQWTYPVNAQVLKDACGVIVHGRYSKQLANTWYGENYAAHWAVIPLVRELPDLPDRKALRRRHGFRQKDFLVCSFGMLGRSKLNDRLLAAWLNSELVRNSSAQLIFVGEPDNGDFGQIFSEQIDKSGYSERIKITGWLDDLSYREYLVMADMAVQLRGSSRGEMSAALHDCMAYGLPTIINAQDCFSETNAKAIFQVAKDFSEDELTQALNLLASKKDYQKKLANEARLEIKHNHSPENCAFKYFESIESFYDGQLTRSNKEKEFSINGTRELSHWQIIKKLRKVHIDSQADLHSRMCEHRKLIEDELSFTKNQLNFTENELAQTKNELAQTKNQFNAILESKSWRITAPIRKIFTFPKKIKYQIKNFTLTSLTFKSLLIDYSVLGRKLKNNIACKCPWIIFFIKLFFRRKKNSSVFVVTEKDLTRSERIVYERLKTAIKDKNFKGH